MKTKLFLILFLFLFVSYIHAEDVDIYGISQIDVKPNVLIILDNSGSMSNEDVPGDPYDPGRTYAGSYNSRTVYVKSGSGWYEYWTQYFNDITSSDWQCASAKEDLTSVGYWQGKLSQNRRTGVITCSGSGGNKNYALGNYLNFESAGGGQERSRMAVAKEVVANLIYENYDKINFGLMTFNYEDGGYIVAGCGAAKSTLIGSYGPGDVMEDANQPVYGAVGKLEGATWTPLAETLGEAGLYFAGKQSWFNRNVNYSDDSPITWRCQKNYIILVTDGEPYHDDDKFGDYTYIGGKIKEERIDSYKNNYNNETDDADDIHYSYLDDVAYFLKHKDIRPDMGTPGDFEDQTITTYTIGFQVNLDLLATTATRGGGEYYQASSASQLGRYLTNIINAVGEQNEIFTAAVVPVSRANNAYAGSYVYFGLFQPTEDGNWFGNLKKYAISANGVILDSNGNPAESSGTIIENAVSFWGSSVDGPSVTAGGAGERLATRENERNIYTYTGTAPALTDRSNLFVANNTTLIDGSYADLTADVIAAVRRGVTTDWPLGSLLHSQPIVVHYDTNSMIYVGANDGMLHCFDDQDGEERWSFVPQDLLSNLSLLYTPTSLQYFVDGSPVVYDYVDGSGNNNKLLIVGERRGGTNYTALDISDYSEPLFKYSISSDILGTGQETLGQSWAAPEIHSMGYMDGSTYKVKDVFLISGGYDINQDEKEPLSRDNVGRAVYAIDAQTGALFNNFLFSHANYPSMTHSIIAASGFENPKSRTTTRIYAGDMNGNLFAFRDDIFDLNSLYDGQEDGVWGQKLKLYSVPGRKIWYAPNILNEYFPVNLTSYVTSESGTTEAQTTTRYRVGDYVFFGTGDRAHPGREDLLDGFYAIKNSWQWPSETPEIFEAYIDIDDEGKVKSKVGSNVIVDWEEETEDTKLFILDVTDDLYQENSQYAYYTKRAINHKNNRGWFIRFEEMDGRQVGEKMASSPIVYAGVIYFTTYIPDAGTPDGSDDPCATSAGGSGYIYALGYEYGEAIINYNSNNDENDEEILKRSDRRKQLKNPGIPPQPVLVVLEGGTKILIGPETVDPKASSSLERAFWRQLNN
jgi:type IV pilus assembly protein PilY1